jgi:hypothetical protein
MLGGFPICWALEIAEICALVFASTIWAAEFFQPLLDLLGCLYQFKEKEKCV